MSNLTVPSPTAGLSSSSLTASTSSSISGSPLGSSSSASSVAQHHAPYTISQLSPSSSATLLVSPTFSSSGTGGGLNSPHGTSSLTSNADLSAYQNEHQQNGNGHFFTKKTFHRPTYCHHCTEMLWGLIGQGFVCEGESLDTSVTNCC